MESGEWRVESGEWRVESGEWRVESRSTGKLVTKFRYYKSHCRTLQRIFDKELAVKVLGFVKLLWSI